MFIVAPQSASELVLWQKLTNHKWQVDELYRKQRQHTKLYIVDQLNDYPVWKSITWEKDDINYRVELPRAKIINETKIAVKKARIYSSVANPPAKGMEQLINLLTGP